MSWVQRCRAWCAARRPSANYLRLFRGCEKADWALIAVGTVAAIAAGVPLPVIGVLFGQMLDQFNQAACQTSMSPEDQDHFLDLVADHVVDIVAVAAANFALVWIYTSCWSAFGERLVRRMRESYVRSLLAQDMTFFDKLPPGAVNTHLSADLLAVQNGTSEKVGILLASLAYFVASYIVAFYKLPVLAAQLVCLVPALLIITLIGAHVGSRFTARASEHLADATGLATEIMTHLRVVQAFEAFAPLRLVYRGFLRRARTSGHYRAIAAATMLGCLFFVAYSANALAFHSGSRLVTDRMRDPNKDANGTVGAVYTVIFLLLDASFVVGQIAPYLQAFSSAGGAGARLLEVERRVPAIDGAADVGVRGEDAPLGFETRDLRFAYPARPDAFVLAGATLTIRPGERVGICGTSGSGKSTVAALLQRFYDPASGSLTLHDGTALDTLCVPWLRAQIGYVGQDAVLADCTVLENIAHGLLDSPKHPELQDALLYLSRHALHEPLGADWLAHVDDAHRGALEEIVRLVEDAARAAHAHTFIEALPAGYRTRVGHSAHTLSGGQKQRMALARAVVKKPRVLVLDEATAALDSHSELAVQAALDAMTEPRTTIAIAHRLATIKHYDRIIVMAHGRVVEQGTHDSLLAHGGYYADLATAQLDDAAGSGGSAPESAAESRAAREGDAAAERASLDAPPDTEVLLDTKEAAAAGAGAGAGAGTEAAALPVPDTASVPEKPATLVPQLTHAQTLARLARFTARTWPFWIVGLAASAVIGGAYSGEAVLFGHVVQALNPCQSPSRVESQADLFALFFFILALIELFAYFLSGSSFGIVAESLLLRVRERVVAVLAAQRLVWYEQRDVAPSSVIADLVADTSNLGGLTGTVIGTIFSILVNLVAGIVLAHAVAWRIAVVILATVPILLLSGYLRLKVLAEFQQRHETVYAKSTAIAVDAARDIQTVAALRRERDVLQLFQYALEKPYRESLRHIVIGNVFLAVSLSISYFIYGFAYWWGSRNVAEGRYSQVAFFTVLPALLFSAQTSGQLLAFGPDLSKAQVSAAHLFSVLEHAKIPREHARDEPRAPRGAADPEKAPAAVARAAAPVPVSFERVVFTYAQRVDPALNGVSFEVPAGAFVALIGESGSGKSTCLSLIENLYTPSAGCVRVGGLDTAAVRTADLRRDMAIVPQDAMLFHGSIAFNVALGLDDPMSADAVRAAAHSVHTPAEVDPRIVQACKEANIHDVITGMPDGYQTDVGPGGTHLSGGQRQRLAIARALVRRPRLLLLDEPTSAMDATSEQAFQNTLDALQSSHACTIVTVAHRMRTIRMADLIVLFSHGRIVARGTHAELMQSCAAYRTMVAHQSVAQ
ncbi:hypothetical protein MOBT1_003257 [Malassezia obtusa]|uniref:Leptomycin B resistance protein pmd1 n=1 Tax=Malassezia obtusa TaxID=76774 RepID=A0AAF0E2E4_9BASI|nr:hypothetical protein MOBT1_003257 [Malassezia obtusa]